MTMNVRGYAAHSSTSPLGLFHFVRRDPRPDDLVIEILYCGICHSDLHNVQNDWGYSKYPMVPGHEMVGRVVKVGASVSKFKVNDHVGVGCLVDSCRICTPCTTGHEQFCAKQATYSYGSLDRIDRLPTQGGYSETIVVSQDFALKIPEGLDLKGVAPLLCAGITTWAPLQRAKITSSSRVAIIGLGGLGHIAIKIAKAMGAEVTLITRHIKKARDAQALGANHVVASTDQEAMSSLKGRFDVIMDTVPYVHDVNPFIATLALNGRFVLLGYFGPLEPPLITAPLIFGQRTIEGSMIGGIAETQAMLDFCGQHHITSNVEVMQIQDVNTAYERMRQSDVKYRFVIDLASLRSEQG
jgi:alcohol dehydrogenase (NADP+)